MGLFDFFKRLPLQAARLPGPYRDNAANYLYKLLFCDNPDLFKTNVKPSYSSPYNVLFSETSTVADLLAIVNDNAADPRSKLLACNRLTAMGKKLKRKEVFGVILEIGLEKGPDVMASFCNGTARYIKQTGKILVWDVPDETTEEMTRELFLRSTKTIAALTSWDKPRKTCPTTGNIRISFLAADGLYFIEDRLYVLFDDLAVNPALVTAVQLLKYLAGRAATE
jgi:hypothetical protein